MTRICIQSVIGPEGGIVSFVTLYSCTYIRIWLNVYCYHYILGLNLGKLKNKNLKSGIKSDQRNILLPFFR